MRRLLILSCVPLLAASAHAEVHTFTGTLGDARIGMTLDVVDPKRDIPLGPSSHYFYVKYLRDIPLEGRVADESIFREPSGGVFELHFTGKPGTRGEPLTLYTSTGLAGTWTQAGKVLPVTLQGDWIAASGVKRYDDVEGVTDAGAFEREVQAFRKAVLADDRDAALRFVHLPVRVNGTGRSRSIATRAALRATWDTVFPPNRRAALAKAIPHDMFVHNGQVMLGDGLAWFDGTGLVAINPSAP